MLERQPPTLPTYLPGLGPPSLRSYRILLSILLTTFTYIYPPLRPYEHTMHLPWTLLLGSLNHEFGSH